MAPGQKEKSGHGSGLPVAIAAVLFLVLRLFAVSGYDWHTAFAVLHTMDVDDSIGIIMGSVMAEARAAAVFLVLLTPVAVLYTRLSLTKDRLPGTDAAEESRHTRPDPRSGALLLLSALVAVSAYVWTFHAWWLPLTAVAVGVLLFAIGYGTKAGGRLERLALGTGRRLGMLIAAGWLIAAATVTTPWVPLERVELRGGETLRGYVMQAEPGFLKVLTEQHREFLILTDQEVSSREEISGH